MSDPADASRIRQLADGVPGGLRGLVELFVSHTTEAAGQLRAAATEARAAEVQMLAHRGAGTAGAFGAVQLTALFRQVEALATQPQMPGIGPHVDALEEELARVHRFLSALLQD